MEGLLYAFFGAIFLALLSVSSKVLAVKSKNPLIISGIFQTLTGILFIPFLFFENPIAFSDKSIWILVGMACCFYVLANIFTFSSFKYIDISLATIVDQIGLVLVYFASIGIFNERNTTAKMLGVFLIVAGNIAVVVINKEVKNKRKFYIGLSLRILYIIFNSIAILIDSNIHTNYEISVYWYGFIVWLVPGIVVSILAFVIGKCKDNIQDIKTSLKGLVAMAFFGVIATVLIYKAYSMADKSLIFPILKLSSILVVLLGIFLLKERKYMKVKIIGSVVVFIGIYLVGVGF